MGRHWVKALTIVRAPDRDGTITNYYPGDWLQVNNMQMRMLLAKGQIEVMPKTRKRALELDDCGVLITGGDITAAKNYMAQVAADMAVTNGALRLPFPRTLIWDGVTSIRLDLLPTAFHRLTTGWQVVAPLLSYTKLARDCGSQEERAATKKVIRDLRVPVYDARSVYIRRCPDTERLVETWKQERASGGDVRLAFLRALYREPPTICAQPIQWVRDGSI